MVLEAKPSLVLVVVLNCLQGFALAWPGLPATLDRPTAPCSLHRARDADGQEAAYLDCLIRQEPLKRCDLAFKVR